MAVTPTTLEYALLGLVRQQPQSGYDLRKLFATTPVRHYSDSPGSIYPALRRLQTRRWIAATQEKTGARRRQQFRVTAEGKRALVKWLHLPVTRDEVIWRYPDLLLRFAFLDGNVSRSVTAKFLAELERELASYIFELQRYASANELLEPANTGGLAFANGLEGYRAQLSWARRARRELLEVAS